MSKATVLVVGVGVMSTALFVASIASLLWLCAPQTLAVHFPSSSWALVPTRLPNVEHGHSTLCFQGPGIPCSTSHLPSVACCRSNKHQQLVAVGIKPAGFYQWTRTRSAKLSLRGAEMRHGLQESEDLLADFDKRQQIYAKENGEGFGGGTSAETFAAEFPDKKGLRAAVERLSAESETVQLGICAETAERGVHVLKEWVSALALPRGRLHGMDEEGVPLDMSDFGAVYIKYSSRGGQVFEPGDANLNGYDGSYRGVYFNPVLADGEFRQYAVLPLDLFHDAASGVLHVIKRSQLTEEEVEELLVPVKATLENLGGEVALVAIKPEAGLVELRYNGPMALTYGIREQLLASSHIKEVSFVA